MTKTVSIPEVLFFQEGPGVRNTQFQTQGIKLLNVGNINNGRINLDTTKVYISESEAYGRYKHFLASEGDLVIASSGIVVSNFHNKIAFVEKQHLPLCLNTSTIRFRPLKKSVIDINYVKYYLQTEFFKGQLKKLITGSAQLNFGPSHLKQIQIPLPSLDEQRRIAALLDRADALRQKDRQLLAHYDQLAQSLFLDLFGDPVRNEKGWEVNSVITYAECIVPGRDKPRSFTGDIQWVTTDDLNHLGWTNSSKKKLGLSLDEVKAVNARIIPKGSVLMTCVGDLGVISIAREDLVVNQQLHTFQCSKRINNVFLMHNLSYQKEYMIKMASSTTVPYMNKTICNSVPVCLPPLPLQNHFATLIEQIDKQKAVVRQQMAASEALFGRLLQESFG